jgi:hypothetical protein
MVVSVAHFRDGIAPQPSDPTSRSFMPPPTLDELDHAEPREETVLSHTVRRVRRERGNPGATIRRGFENKV